MFPVVTPMYNTCNNSSNKYKFYKKLKDVGGYMKKLSNMIYSSEQVSERYMQFKKGKTMRRYKYLTKNSFHNNANSCNYTNEKYYNEEMVIVILVFSVNNTQLNCAFVLKAIEMQHALEVHV